jgi:CRISPR/Cas system-associated exonuclease Cas4 (RecB family)
MIAPAAPHPNQIAEQLTGRAYTSWSAISCYCACPLRYAFRYVENLPEPTVSAALAFGGAFHRACEHHYRELLEGRPAPVLDALMTAYNDAWTEHDGKAIQYGKDDDRGTLDDLAGRMLAAFQNSKVANPPGTIIGIEEELTGELVPGVPDLLARVDLLVDDGDGLVITDLKTARSRWSAEQVRESAGQLLLYHELAKPMADGRPIRLQFAVATKLKNPDVHLYQVDADPQQIDRMKRIVERVWEGIEKRIFYPSPSAMQCPSCPFREQCRDWGG